MKKPYLLLPALLLAGCRSEQLALQAPPAASAVAVAPAPVAPEAEPAALSAATVSLKLPVQPVAQLGRQRHASRVVSPVATAGPMVPTASPWPTTARPRQLARLLRRPHTTHGAAESGLEGIGVFAIVVVLALLAGLGALVSLIPGVSFLGGVGLAVAGLLVIGLLFKLLSGHKKK
ncbi:MAG: hypothetical protein ACRYFX_00840 [Janthinobacterium lividum]